MTRNNGYNNNKYTGSRKHPASETAPLTPASKRPAFEKISREAQVSKVSRSDLGGCDAQFLEACRYVAHLKKPNLYERIGMTPPRGFLVHGPPGCGKTTFAKALAGELNIALFCVSATELIGGISGESERRIRELFADVGNCESPSILLLDEIDVIAGKRENAQREMEKRIVSQLIASLTELKPSVVVIGTTRNAEVLDPSLRCAGRFDHEIAFGIPDEQARIQILNILTRGLHLKEDITVKTLARLTPGYVGNDLRSLVREASLCAMNRVFNTSILHLENENKQKRDVQVAHELDKMLEWLKSDKIEDLKEEDSFIVMEDFTNALSRIMPTAKREGFATVPDVSWVDIGALKSIRSELEWSILNPIQQPEVFEIFATNPRPQGVLLCGPPGCGKTLLAKAVANETGMNFISVKGPELLSMYVGESERAVRTVFQRACNSSPCVIFFDEIDALCPKRSSSESTGSARLVNQLLTEMDGMETRKQVFLIGATNRPDMIDPAVLRPGRLDKLLFVDFPSVEERADILRKATKNGTRPRVCPTVNFDEIAANTALDSFSGADLVALIHEAGIVALKKRIEQNDESKDSLTTGDFEEAMRKVMPSVGAADRERYVKLKLLYTEKVHK